MTRILIADHGRAPPSHSGRRTAQWKSERKGCRS